MDTWNFEENKAFENTIAEFGNECPTLFQEIVLRVPGKSIEEIRKHHAELVRDVEMVENGFFDEALTDTCNVRNPVQRRKGTPWSEAEHKEFLIGLEKYGKGDWRSISRYCVKTRSPTQVASHAQKYFKKLKRFSQPQETEAKLHVQVAASDANNNVNSQQ